MKTEERVAARRLRAVEGASIKDIAAQLSVSTSSVSRWVRDIALSADALAALEKRNPARNGELVRQSNLRRARERRRACQENGRLIAAAEPTSLHLMGCMLYWAEGSRSKKDVQFTNSDPAMIRLFVEFLESCYKAPLESIGLRCYLFADSQVPGGGVTRR